MAVAGRQNQSSKSRLSLHSRVTLPSALEFYNFFPFFSPRSTKDSCGYGLHFLFYLSTVKCLSEAFFLLSPCSDMEHSAV